MRLRRREAGQCAGPPRVHDTRACDAALARYVEKLTLRPGDISESDIGALRAVGFDDLDILDANNQCAHLNYTNRVANGLGLLTEAAMAERSRDRVPQ